MTRPSGAWVPSRSSPLFRTVPLRLMEGGVPCHRLSSDWRTLMRELSPNLWQLGGFPPNAFNVYLIGDVLIDAATRWGSGRILRQIGDRKPSMLALTHVHPDHQGCARMICERYAIPLACHARRRGDDAGRATDAAGSPLHAVCLTPLVRTGLPRRPCLAGGRGGGRVSSRSMHRATRRGTSSCSVRKIGSPSSET